MSRPYRRPERIAVHRVDFIESLNPSLQAVEFAGACKSFKQILTLFGHTLAHARDGEQGYGSVSLCNSLVLAHW